MRHLARRLLTESREQFENIRPERIEELIASEGELIAMELKGMARIASLAAEYLPQVLREEISLREALRRVKDFGPWLLQELPEHPSTWATVVALVLCSASSAQEGAPWCQFEAVRRALFQHMSREQGQRSRRSLQEICCGDDLLRQARAEIVRESSPVRVQFLERRYPDLLWEVLLGKGRDITATIIPLLKTLAEGDDLYTGKAAAIALGRIGQIDPHYITYPLIRRWSTPDGIRGNRRDFRDRGTLLGSLFQGILGTPRENEDYQRECLQFLQRLLQSGANGAVQAAVVSLSNIAMSNHPRFEFSMRALRDIAAKRLAPQWDVLRGLADMMRELGRNGGEKKILCLLEELLEVKGNTVDDIPRLAANLFSKLIVAPDSLQILSSFDVALGGLFFHTTSAGPSWNIWWNGFRKIKRSSARCVTYLFLQSGGISSQLERLAVLQQQGNGEDAVGSLFLESVHDDLKGIAALSRFLPQLYLHLHAFPGLLRVQLEENYLRLLASCAREGRALPRLRPDRGEHPRLSLRVPRRGDERTYPPARTGAPGISGSRRPPATRHRSSNSTVSPLIPGVGRRPPLQ